MGHQGQEGQDMTAAGPMKTTTPDKSDCITGVAGRVNTEELEALRRTTTLMTGAVHSSETLVNLPDYIFENNMNFYCH
jgi:hypothetical protein